MSYIPFKTPASYWVAGPTGSGKTEMTRKLIHHRHKMFETPPVEVHYCYREYQSEVFSEMEKKDGVVFHQGVPTLETMKAWSQDVSGAHLLVVLDDMQNEIVKSQEMATVFSVLSHHSNISIMCLVQNIFPQARYSRDISLNCGYMMLMNTKRDRLQLTSLARQLCPGNVRFFTSAFEDAVSSKSYGYLVVDMHPATPPKYMLRTNIWPDEMTIVYKPVV